MDVLLPPMSSVAMSSAVVKTCQGGRHTLALVTEGVGHSACGQPASVLTAQRLIDRIERACCSVSPLDALLERSLIEINAALYVGQLHSTLALAILEENHHLHLVNVGDCRVYLRRAQDLMQLSRDHSLAALQVEQHLYPLHALSSHPRRHVLYRRLGAEATIAREKRMFKVEQGDRVLLCTRGLWETLSETELWSFLCLPFAASQVATLLQKRVTERSEGSVGLVILDVMKEEETC